MKTKNSLTMKGLKIFIAATLLALFGTSCQTTLLPNGMVSVRPLPGMFCAPPIGGPAMCPPRMVMSQPMRCGPPPMCSSPWNGGYVRSPYGPSVYSSGFGPFYRPGGYNCRTLGAPWQAQWNPVFTPRPACYSPRGGGRWY